MFIGVIIVSCKRSNIPNGLKVRIIPLAASDRWQADSETKKEAEKFAEALQHQTLNGALSMEYAIYPIDETEIRPGIPLSDLGRTWIPSVPKVEIEFVKDEEEGQDEEEDEWNS